MAKKFQLSASSPHCALPSHFPPKMFNLSCFFLLFLLHFAAVNGDEAVGLQAFSGVPVVVSVPVESLGLVSRSVVEAESWVRSHVLAHYPATNITTIGVGESFLCGEERVGLVLPSMKNIHYSLTRWGLGGEIKVSTSFSPSCLQYQSYAETYVKPVLEFFREIDAPYLVTPSSDLSISEFIKNLGGFSLKKIHLMAENERQERAKPRSRSRRLSLFDSLFADSVPARPWLIAPAQPPTGSSSPAFAAKSPLPPLIGSFPPPPLSLPAPMFNPATPPYGPHLPPCKPSGGEVSVPPAPAHGGLWCVAKPNVPPETLKEALDYACGEGGADCQAISPHGSCYFPNTIVAHASYAFNSYWQRSKKIGGTCGFEGTAMLINSDPSYRHCRFILA